MKNQLHNDIRPYRIILTLRVYFTPEVIVALGSGAIGGLGGLLTPSPINR